MTGALPPEVESAAKERGRQRDLFETAAAMLETLEGEIGQSLFETG